MTSMARRHTILRGRALCALLALRAAIVICADEQKSSGKANPSIPPKFSSSSEIGGDAFGIEQIGKEGMNCRHGNWDPELKKCNCSVGWATAGITDTLDFLEGTCEQYHCVSDQKCQEVLNIPEATCPVKNWNCYCGFKWAVLNFGHGYETQQKEGGGECMGVMYAFSVYATDFVEWFMSLAWKFILPLAIVALPFGRKRAICDHHWPSLWNGLRHLIGCVVRCDGTCVMSTSYTIDSFKDDIAWTIYVLDIGVWIYVFLGTLWLVTMFIWSMVLWLAVVVVIFIVMVVGLCTLLGEGAEGCFACETGGCGGCGTAECCGANCMFMDPGGASTQMDMMYYGGTFPYDPWWGYSLGSPGGWGTASDQDDCCCFSSSLCCKPIAWLFYVYPVMPENAWGGLIGYWLGTHVFTPPDRLYTGGSRLAEFLRMGWRRSNDLHGDDSWREQVRRFVSGEVHTAAGAPNGHPPYAESMAEPIARYQVRRPLATSSDETQGFIGQGSSEIIRIGRAHAIKIERPFNRSEHGCVESSFEDYQKNCCWICTSSCDEWDLWLSCRHLFCRDCSSEMLRRRMPCPLCRVSSSAVSRGLAWNPTS